MNHRGSSLRKDIVPVNPLWLNNEELNCLTNTIGNLLALSQPKNSSLQNDCYESKRVDGEKSRGYFNGSYSECRVAETYKEWTPESIKERGLELLEFMEERWDINLGDDETKLKLLNIEFIMNNRY